MVFSLCTDLQACRGGRRAAGGGGRAGIMEATVCLYAVWSQRKPAHRDRQLGGDMERGSLFNPSPTQEAGQAWRRPSDLEGICHFSFSSHLSDKQARLHNGRMVKWLLHTGSQKRWNFPGRIVKITLNG